MLRSVLAGMVGLSATVGLGSSPASAGGWCDCDGPASHYVVYEPRRTYDYEPRVVAYYSDFRAFNRRFDPRWTYAAAYYGPRAYSYYRPYGYAYVSRGPAVLVHPYHARRHWRHRR